MHIVMPTAGTRGDVQPFVALGLGLKRAGHDVTIATHVDHEELVTGRGLAFRPICGSFKAILESGEGREWLESGGSVLRFKRALRRTFLSRNAGWIAESHDAVLDADAVMFHPFAIGAYHAAEQRRVPAVVVAPYPVLRSGELEPLAMPQAPAWPWLRRRIGDLAAWAFFSVMRDGHNDHRRRLGLPLFRTMNPWAEIHAKGVPFVHLYSTSLVPRPRDWAQHAHVTGFCFLDDESEWTPPPALASFLKAGPTPIYVGFGSMTGRDPGELTRLAVAAITRAKQRAVLVRGWGGIDGDTALPDHVLALESVSHEWLFPRVSAVVHHGGAGTTAAGLRAGRPTLVTAFFGDQRFWGHHVARIGAGPSALLKRGLDAGRLAAAITATVGGARHRVAAARASEALVSEDGVAAAVATIQRYLSASC